MTGVARPPIEIGLNAAIVTVEEQQPLILVVDTQQNRDTPSGLPFGPFDPIAHRTLEMGLRAWVAEQTALKLGYVEQLYTFGDRGRHAHHGDREPHLVSVGYLALTRPDPSAAQALTVAGAHWRRWYDYFPWEDWRDGRPPLLDKALLPALRRWARLPAPGERGRHGIDRQQRVRLAFGSSGERWDEERVLERYELLYEAGLIDEAVRDGSEPAERPLPATAGGAPMRFDHRRILATAISRLRAKLKYRPVVFELMAPEFTLTDLQLTVEAISGRHLHKQNFRRLVESATLVEPTGTAAPLRRGRPAALFRFRREVLNERPAPGLRVGSRS
ncbi:MAG: NAD regulator [Hyphomicrobiales bacterium]|nr:NAD regulator [Hyphomicrobiales bacterium]